MGLVETAQMLATHIGGLAISIMFFMWGTGISRVYGAKEPSETNALGAILGFVITISFGILCLVVTLTSLIIAMLKVRGVISG